MRIITKNGKQTSPNLNNCELRDCCIQMMFDPDIAMGRHSGTWKQLCSMARGSIIVLIRTFIILAIPPFTTLRGPLQVCWHGGCREAQGDTLRGCPFYPATIEHF